MAHWTVVRHGQSTANAAGVLSGWHDVELTELGVRQAEIAGGNLAGKSFDKVVTSDLQRAHETAKIIMSRWSALNSNASYEIEVDTRFRERNFKHYQGVSKSVLRKNGIMKAIQEWESSPEGIESYHALYRRVLPALIDHSSKRNCLLVAHGGVIRVLLKHFGMVKDDRFSMFDVKNCEPIELGNIQINQYLY